MRRHTRVLALLLTVALAGCGDDGPLQNTVDTSLAATPSTTAASDTTIVDTTEPAVGGDDVVAGIDFGGVDLPPGEPYDGYAEIVDDTGTIQVEVPADWTDTDTAPRSPEGEGQTDGSWPSVGASTDIDDFYGGEWGAPGVVVVNKVSAESEQGELDELDERIDLSGNCDGVTAFDYDDGSYTGLAELWTGCGPNDAAELAISTFVGEDHLSAFLTLMTDADIDASIRVIETFRFAGE